MTLKKVLIAVPMLNTFQKYFVLIVSPDESRGYYGSCTVVVRVRVIVRVIVRVVVHVRRDFLVFELQATFLKGFLLNLAGALLWQRSHHPVVLVLLESKL